MPLVRRLSFAFAVGAVLALGACNGDDIAALPEAAGGATCELPTGAASPTSVVQFDRGHWVGDGTHDPTNDIAAAGWSGTSNSDLRAYFQFDLSVVTGSGITGATLRLPNVGWFSGDTTEDFSLWQVTTSSAELDSDATITPNVAVFNDLGDGAAYGAFQAAQSEVGAVYDIPLSDAALCDLNAALGAPFAVGLRGDSLTRPVGVDEGVQFGVSGTDINELVLQVVP